MEIGGFNYFLLLRPSPSVVGRMTPISLILLFSFVPFRGPERLGLPPLFFGEARLAFYVCPMIVSRSLWLPHI